MTLVTRQAMSDDGGDFISGTEVDKAFIDQIYDQIDDQLHSSTNPTIKPKAVTDEVVAARGSKASLDARLDVSLEEDGSLKTQASLLTVAQGQTLLHSRNVVPNGDLALWANGGALAPDGWTLTGAGAVIARCGTGMGDTTTFGTGRFCASLQRVGNDIDFTAPIVAAADITDFASIKGQKFSVAIKAKASVANVVRVIIDDGATTTASSYHTGGGTEEALTVTHTISNSATKLEVTIEVNSTNTTVYVGGVVGVFADVAVDDWAPYTGRVPQRLRESPHFYTNTTSVGNVGGGTDDLMSLKLSPNTLRGDGMMLRILATFFLANNGNAKTINFVFGGTTITLHSAVTTANVAVFCQILVIRTGAATQLLIGMSAINGVLPSVQGGLPTETLANEVTLKFTALSGASATDDIIQTSMVVEVL